MALAQAALHSYRLYKLALCSKNIPEASRCERARFVRRTMQGQTALHKQGRGVLSLSVQPKRPKEGRGEHRRDCGGTRERGSKERPTNEPPAGRGWPIRLHSGS